LLCCSILISTKNNSNSYLKKKQSRRANQISKFAGDPDAIAEFDAEKKADAKLKRDGKKKERKEYDHGKKRERKMNFKEGGQLMQTSWSIGTF
jgi:hypothetical protein